MRNKAINAMLELGISANTMGFEYIADAMEQPHPHGWNVLSGMHSRVHLPMHRLKQQRNG